MKNIFAIIVLLASFIVGCKSRENTGKKASPTEADSTAVKKEGNSDTLPVLGIDVSHFQQDVNWDEIKAAKISFTYIKATQSTGFEDPKFKKNWQGAKTAGLYRGAYHFYLSDKDAAQQAENFLKVVSQLEKGDMPPALDLEELGMKGNVSKEKLQEGALLWLKTVEDKLGITPIVYADLSFANTYLDNPELGKYALWIAEYGTQTPQVPQTWKDKGWMIWQRTE